MEQNKNHQPATDKSATINKLPEDPRDQGNSTTDWNAEQNESGRRK